MVLSCIYLARVGWRVHTVVPLQPEGGPQQLHAGDSKPFLVCVPVTYKTPGSLFCSVFCRAQAEQRPEETVSLVKIKALF